MLDAYIIDAIREQEEARERAFDRRRARLELPLPLWDMPRRDDSAGDEEVERGPIVIPLNRPSTPEEDAA